MMRVRKLLFHRVMFGFYGTVAVSFLLLLVQGLRGQSSFTVASLLFPVIAMMYILHSNPFDALLGTNDVNAMLDYVQYSYDKKQSFILMSLYMREFEETGKDFPQNM